MCTEVGEDRFRRSSQRSAHGINRPVSRTLTAHLAVPTLRKLRSRLYPSFFTPSGPREKLRRALKNCRSRASEDCLWTANEPTYRAEILRGTSACPYGAVRVVGIARTDDFRKSSMKSTKSRSRLINARRTWGPSFCVRNTIGRICTANEAFPRHRETERRVFGDEVEF